MAALNHPKIGDSIKVEPIRTEKDVKNIKKHLADKPRDLAIFTLGINTNLRASDLLRITIGQVRYLQPGEHFTLKEQKTGKERVISINKTMYDATQALLKTMPDAQDKDLLFQSRKAQPRKPIKKDGKVTRQPGTGELSVPYLNSLVKAWCAEINLRGNYGAHTLRKTFGYIQRTIFKVDIPTLMRVYNHSTQAQTLEYLCIQPEEIRSVYMNEI